MSLVEIEFKGRRKGVFVNSNNLELKREDRVIVRADRGIDLGKVTLLGEEWQENLTRLHNVAMDASGHANGNGNGNGKANDSSDKKPSSEAADTAVADKPKPEEQETAETVETSPEPEPNHESNDTANADSPTEADTQDVDSSDEEKSAETAEQTDETPELQIDGDLPEVIRIASEEDLTQESENRNAEKEARTFFLQEVRRLELVMKLVDIEYQLDRKKLTFYFTADGRVDFRELVKSLAQYFRTRIDLRQIGARDESKRIGGIGLCGRELCCSAWIREFKPVTTSMLKEQGLLMNPQKNTGLCGKLRCCLRYEVDQYREVNRLFPKEGMMVKGPRGAGVVEKVSMCHSSLGVRWEDGNRIGYSFDQIRNITDWDPEKRAEIEIITFSNDPSIVVQEKDEREGRLLTSFEYEAATDRSQKAKEEQQNNRRKPRRRGRRSKGGSDDRPRRPENGPVIVQAVEVVPEKKQESGSGDSRSRDRDNRQKSRGRRDKRRDNKPRSEQQQQTQGQKSDAAVESGERNRDDKNKSRRRGRRGKQKNRENGPQDQQKQNRPDHTQQTKENTSPTGSGGESSKPKGNPVHSRGRRRKR